MEPLISGVVFFIGTLAAALIGMRLRPKLKQEYLIQESMSAMKLAVGMISTMTALILGLVIASTQSNFNKVENDVGDVAVRILTLDRLLVHYGNEANGVRGELKGVVSSMISPQMNYFKTEQDAVIRQHKSGMEDVINDSLTLNPANELQKKTFSQIDRVTGGLLMSRWHAINSIGRSVSAVFHASLFIWLIVIFFSFGLLSPSNPLVKIGFVLTSFCMANAIFLIDELDGAYDGLVTVGKEPLIFIYNLLNR